MLQILVLCTGNSCRSILLEAILNHHGRGMLQAYSAGSNPAGHVHPMSLVVLQRRGIETAGLHSKSWDVFMNASIDMVITVCGNAAAEQCPVFISSQHKKPLRIHWGVVDPAHGKEADFEQTFMILEKRALAMLALPLDALDVHKDALQAIGNL